MPTNSEQFNTNISTACIFSFSPCAWPQSELLESTFFIRIQLQTKVPFKTICNGCIAKSKVKRHLPMGVGTRFSNRMHFQTEEQLSHFHLQKKAYVVLKLYMLPSGNKRFNFASFQACYILLQKHCKLPWDFIVRKHLEMGRIFSIIYLLLMHKCCLSYSCCHKKSMCFNSFYTALNNGPADMNSSNVYRKTLWRLDSFTCEIGNYHEKWKCSHILNTTIF